MVGGEAFKVYLEAFATGLRSLVPASSSPLPDERDDDRPRKIVHVDMDAFFASVEQRDNPELRGKPVAVGGSRERGVVAAASYEARKFGVRSAMPSVTAKRLCPELIFVKPRFDVYRQVSQQIRAIFAEYTPIIEPLSLDEAYLDVTENLKGIPYASQVAKEIRARILEETNLTASAGVGPNRFLAKMASDQNKPNGQFVITPDQAETFVEGLKIEKFHGIGPATAEKMHQMGIFTGADLKRQPLALLQERFGKSGTHYYWISRGIDRRPVQPDRIRKSIGAENTFIRDLFRPEEMESEMVPLAEKVWQHSVRTQSHGRTVTLKVKFEDFRQITRSRTLSLPVSSAKEVHETARLLLATVLPSDKGVRLLGITLSGFEHEERREDSPQLTLDL